MAAIDLLVDDFDIDVPINDRDESERQALRLARALRLVADRDPTTARLLLDQLVVALDRALDGRFLDYLEGSDREAIAMILRNAR
jgi:hypothetical protein